jgi:hypothetical protein
MARRQEGDDALVYVYSMLRVFHHSMWTYKRSGSHQVYAKFIAMDFDIDLQHSP